MTVANGQFKLDGKPHTLFSGEIHYFRLPANLWKRHLRKARQAGLNTVSFYVPWMWHEPSEGRFDFEGKTHPQRNLLKFIRLAQAEGLHVSARVGPVSNAELVGEGIPGWVLKKYPQVYVQRSGVNNLPHGILLSYLNPKFQELVGKWYAKALPLIAARQIHRGGPIVLVQLCNEIGMIHWLHKTPAEMGARPRGEPTKKTIGAFFNWALSRRQYYARYFKFLADLAKRKGIAVPLSANIPQFYDYDVRGRGVFSPMTTSLFRDFSALVPGTVFGGAYQLRRVDFENFHDISITTEAVRSISLSGESGPRPPIICAELQTGILRDKPRLYPSDIELNLLTSAAHGLNGLNCYMFSSGINLPGMGCLGTYHDWQAPVGLNGEERPHLAPIRRWGAFIRKWGNRLAETEKVTDTALGFYLPYFATEYFSGDFTERLQAARNAHFFDGLARLVQLAGFNFSMPDLLKETPASLARRPSLCLFSQEWMDPATQNRLAGYVRGGGRLLIGPRLPLFDLSGKPCEILVKSLGIRVIPKQKAEKVLRGRAEFYPEFPIQTFTGKFKKLAQTQSGDACAAQGAAGKGRWVAHGFGLMHNFDYQVDMAESWLSTLGIRRQVEARPRDVHAVLRWGKNSGFLFLMNYHETQRAGTCRVKVPGADGVFEKSFKISGRSGVVFSLVINQNNKIAEVR